MWKKHLYRALLACLLILSLIAAIVISTRQDRPAGLSFMYRVPTTSSFVFPRAYISGAVANPGVYEISTDMRINQLIEHAGGFTENADSEIVASSITLSEKVKDAQHVFVPIMQNTLSTRSNSDEDTIGLISLNSSSLSRLMEIPGVGESTATKIIEGRPYLKIDDVKNVSGIGDSKYLQFLDYVTL